MKFTVEIELDREHYDELRFKALVDGEVIAEEARATDLLHDLRTEVEHRMRREYDI